MKNIATVIFILFIVTCSHAQTASVDWLAGTWDRVNVKSGRTAHERWEKISETEWRGFGVMMQGSDTIFLEKISIVMVNNEWFYVADVPENTAPVYFKFTQFENDKFVCENPSHDFPKMIEYWLDDHQLKARVSGDGKSIDYVFAKRN